MTGGRNKIVGDEINLQKIKIFYTGWKSSNDWEMRDYKKEKCFGEF